MLKNIFEDFFVWDTFLHTLSGFIFAFFGYKLVKKIRKDNKKILSYVFIICFSMTISIFWEFIEFSSDLFFLTDMQKDRIVQNFNSFKANEKNNNKSIKVKDIDHTILYDESNNKLLIVDGYLDIGLIDTMKDMFVI